MSSIIEDFKNCGCNYALNEFKYCGWMDDDGKFKDGIQELICRNVCEVLKTIYFQEHSGFSHGYLVSMLKRLMDDEPIKPLTGKDDEWDEATSDGIKWNKRFHRVIKDSDGFTYDIEGRLFRVKKNETYFSCNASGKYVKFPYTPKIEYITLDHDLTNEEIEAYKKADRDEWKKDMASKKIK